jgi:hypothetical protein
MRKFYIAATLLATVLLASLTILSQTQSGNDQRKETEATRVEREKKSLSASKEDRNKYSDFLKLKNTGLIRLLPREKYDTPELQRKNRGRVAPASFPRKTFDDFQSRPVFTDINDVPRVGTASGAPNSPVVPKRSGDARGGGAYYSFTHKSHEYGYATELSLEQGQFQVGFYGENYGFLTDIGDVALESVDLNTPAAKSLATYKRAKHEADARLESRRFDQGLTLDGVEVKSRLPMRLNSTYVLRAINYDEADVLVAFKVVEIDSDGSPLILWKQLKRYSTPQRYRN